MGLDMYLVGEKYLWENEDTKPMEDGFRLKSKELELGYWRKHPNLHGFIVREFADSVDNCGKIELSEEDLKKILTAVEADELPETSGFFFGTSRPDDKPPTIKILKDALEWLAVEEKHIYRTVYYEASW
jgi:hypothetical protein